jgi:iron complex outermembrane receptor protein
MNMRAMFGGVSAAALISMGVVFPAQAQGVAATTEGSTLGEIVVTARRQTESLQDVPQTVNAVAADTLQKLNITAFQDIQTVVPGLTLQQGNSAFGAAASLRGVSYSAFLAGQPTVASYLNDAPSIPVETFQSLFDIGQVEVLKGPQGTTRGVAAPSGAITITTRRADTSQFGGYASVIATDLGGRNAQGAINVPIIQDVLAVRVAAVIDQNDFDGVRSIHNSLRPYMKSTGERLSVSFTPNNDFEAHVAYQHLDRSQSGYQQVVGQGFGINPPINAKQRVSVQDQPTTFQQQFQRVTAQVDYDVLGQHLSYVGAYNWFKLKSPAAQDTGNVLPGAEVFQDSRSVSEGTSHEIRISSDPAADRFFDYTVGAFYQWAHPSTVVVNPGPFFPGAFGSPAGAPNISAFNPAFQIPVLITGPSDIQETSLFGAVTLHLGPKTEFSAGVRQIFSIYKTKLNIVLGDGQTALPAAAFGGNCAALQLPSTYPGFCDVRLPTGGTIVSNTSSRSSDSPTIYNFSLSHRFTDDLMLYATTGSSWLPPAPSFGVQGDITSSPDPVIRALTFHPASKSKSYEVGGKATFLDGRARVNASVFRQNFKNLPIYVPGISYLNTATGQPAQYNFTASVDAVVQGFDLDAAWQITPEWNIAAQASYAHSKVKDSQVPCNITGPNGQPIFNSGDARYPQGLVSLCPGGSASQLPLWNLTVQTEYVRPVRGDVDGFVRGLLNYYPENKYIQPNFTAPKYALLNVYLGLRSDDGAWEASLFARNVLGTEKQLDQSPTPINSLAGSLAGSFPQLNVPSNYFLVPAYTPRREVGVSLRYAWGSR